MAKKRYTILPLYICQQNIILSTKKLLSAKDTSKIIQMSSLNKLNGRTWLLMMNKVKPALSYKCLTIIMW